MSGMGKSERPWKFAAVHEKNSWRKATHLSRENAIEGIDGAENLLRGRERVGKKAADAEFGKAFAVFVWHKDALDEEPATALRLAPGSSHEVETTSVPVRLLRPFEKSGGPTFEQIQTWFETGAPAPKALLGPELPDQAPVKGPSVHETYLSIRPKVLHTIYQVALQAGLSGTPWEFSRETGEPISPSNALYQNALWSFGGGTEPYLASIWWKHMDVEEDRIKHRGNFRAEAQMMANKKTEMKIAGERDTRLAMKIKKANAYGALITDAYRSHRSIRIAIVDGPVPKTNEAAYDSSRAEKRELDPEAWWVHSLSLDGAYILVRGVEPPPRVTEDPFDDAPEPGFADGLMEWLANAPLSDTEKDAVVKVRVGQGYFRDMLIERWKGCAVNQCRNKSLLIASHIKPWSKCETRVERLSPDNGILLSPTLDKAFDAGLISFNDKFKILLHPNMDLQTRNTLPILETMHLTQQHAGMRPFLQWHRRFHGFEPPGGIDVPHNVKNGIRR